MDRRRPPGRRPPQLVVDFPAGAEVIELRSAGTDSTAGSPTTRQLIPPPRSWIGPRAIGMQNYPGASAGESSESLLAPGRLNQVRQYQELPADSPPATPSIMSRRSSWSSIGSRESKLGPFASAEDSRPPSRVGDEDVVNTQTIVQQYNITPTPGMILFPGDVEEDDDLHRPGPEDNKRDCQLCSSRGMTNLTAMSVLVVGLLTLMIGYPLLTFAQREGLIKTHSCAHDSNCLSEDFPLLKNLRTALIDPDTPRSAMTKTAKDGTSLKLVFSDEFNKDGRTFYDGDDPFFQAVDIWYGVTQDLEYYDPDAVSTANGTLNIKFDAFQNHNLNYRSGMVQSWNKLCFTGGRLEASISLPGRGDVSGFWPGFWAMGNLARPGYAATTDGMWPYSYHDGCDEGITPNQSSTDGLSLLPGMRLPACTCDKEDHPSPGNSRSAPEIDAIEANIGYLGPDEYGAPTGSASQSFQAAPFDIWYQPDYAYVEVYDNAVTEMNPYRGGPYQEAMSGLTWLNNDWYDGNAYQTYGFEYTPGGSGDIAWFVGDKYTWKLDARAMRPNGNVGQRVVPTEPMAVVLNFGMADSFTTIMLANIAELLPATMRFDYIRIYQPEGEESVTCDPDDYPTTEYIKKHPKPYANQNLTTWDKAGYSWPKNTLMNSCSA